MTIAASIRTTAADISDEVVQRYQHEGFAHISAVITGEQAARFHAAALELASRMASLHKGPIFTQLVNVWREDPTLSQLTLDPNIGAIAEKLAGVHLRLWHDQVLIKQPHNQAPTEFHQDQPYWPHANSSQPISAWIALCDVPVERGCMTFIPGSHTRTELPMQNLSDHASLFTICPDLTWAPRVTVPLKAGDCTFHHGRTAHMATANMTDDPRVAHVVIYVDAVTTFTGRRHVVTERLDLQPGSELTGELFPKVDELGSS